MSDTPVIQIPEPQEFQTLFTDRDWDALQDILDTMADPDVAILLPTLDRQDWPVLLNLLPPERAASVYAYLTSEQQTALLEDLSDDEKAQIIEELSYDDATALLDELPDEHAELLMDMLPSEAQQVLHSLLAYPEDSAGRLMTPDFVDLNPHWTMREALAHVRRYAEDRETINTLFITDDGNKLMGWMRLQDLLLARPDTRVIQHVNSDVVSITAEADQEEAARVIRHYDLEVLPVIDPKGILLGIITVDDVMDVVEEETTEDFHKLGAVSVLNLSLTEATAALLYRKRIGWLIILVMVNIFSGAAIALFETAIEQVVALVFFLPLVIACGGNAGAQASTLMVRALATGDVHLQDCFRLWGKELLVALGLGITMGLAVWGASVWLGGPEVGMAVAIAMVLVVVTGSMIGMLLPFLLTRFNLDPATSSVPLITSIVDIAGILMYFSVASVILHVSAG